MDRLKGMKDQRGGSYRGASPISSSGSLNAGDPGLEDISDEGEIFDTDDEIEKAPIAKSNQNPGLEDVSDEGELEEGKLEDISDDDENDKKPEQGLEDISDDGEIFSSEDEK